MKSYLKLLLTYMMKVFLFPFKILPIKGNRVLFIGIEGGGANEYTCNPMYICEALLEEYKEQFQICWLVPDFSTYQFLTEKGILTARHLSLKGIWYCLTSKVIVSNGGYAAWFPFRSNQIFINTWHGGGAYKKLETDKADSNWATRQRMRFCGRNVRLFLSSCKLFTQYVIRGVFQYGGEVMEVGMPRNDIFFQNNQECYKKKVRSFYQIPEGKKIALYAPTYRQDMDEDVEGLDFERLKDSLSRRFPGDWCVIYRGHCSEKKKEDILDISMHDGSKYENMQELLCCADVLITDYSSCVWDYSLTGKPLFLFVPDLEEYLQKVGFYVPIEKWHFPIAKSNDALQKEIENFDLEDYKEAVKKHHEELGSFENGHATECVVKKIYSLCFEGEKNDITNSSRS